MTKESFTSYEKDAARAFDRQATVFDNLYASDAMIQYKRKRVRAHVEKFLPSNATILELNAGTGEDSIYFASLGHRVHATDISPVMMEQLQRKKTVQGAGLPVTSERCSFNSLETLTNKGPFDLVFSNFGGLNCSSNLAGVLQSLRRLVKPGGYVTLVIMPPFCLWESLLAFKGKFRTAFRRQCGKNGALAHIEGEYFRTWYHSPGYVRKKIGNHFNMQQLEALCSVVPPSYISGFPEKHPSLFQHLVKWEDRLKESFFWRSVGDYYIITLSKTG
jgi:ubiquinone/menaquinone biosynthesis C-methylase UbiE